MAWRRGTQNQQAGVIRMGHVKEFLAPSSKADALDSERVSLKVVDTAATLADVLGGGAVAYARPDDDSFPAALAQRVRASGAFVHAHEHPAVVLRLVAHEGVPRGCVALSELQRHNHRVCLHDTVEWCVYRGRHVTTDAREAAMGATEVRQRTALDAPLAAVTFEVRPRFDGAAKPLDGPRLCAAFARHVFDCVVTTSETFIVQYDSIEVVGRLLELRVASADDADADAADDDDDDEQDCFRGLVTASTACYVRVDVAAPIALVLVPRPPEPPPQRRRLDVVDVTCSDDEVFPVRRELLRPCLALTSAVQQGKGKYAPAAAAAEEAAEAGVNVPLDCCTFDRVLLYLQHEHARSRCDAPFRFDPTLAAELLDAATALKIAGLADACNKVLGSFKERVRKVPIRFSEVTRRNAAGAKLTDAGTRSETWLVLDGMVLDISRWLDEHPGGASIIPEQALDVDCTAFFEIYHVSRQSFLYLKEFYIGELAAEDREGVPMPKTQEGLAPEGAASHAFLAELRRYTQWRLRPEDLTQPTFKSF